jgi:hypothetical protein
MWFPNGNHRLYNPWTNHYNEDVARGSNDFFDLAVSSFQFLSHAVANLVD